MPTKNSKPLKTKTSKGHTKLKETQKKAFILVVTTFSLAVLAIIAFKVMNKIPSVVYKEETLGLTTQVCPENHICINSENLNNYATPINSTFKKLTINQNLCGSCAGILINGITINAGFNATNAIRVDGVSNVRIENSTIIGGETGIFVLGSRNIEIINNIIKDQSDVTKTLSNGTLDTEWSGRGIRLSNTLGNDNILIKGNTITNNDSDGIMVAQHDINKVYNTNVKILDNVIDGVAKPSGYDSLGKPIYPWPGHYHGMYIQAGDTIIQGNIVKNVGDGNGISLRSSGTVSCNYVANVGKAGISYFADHGRGVNNLLTIENNVINNTGLNEDECCRLQPAIRLLNVPSTTEYYVGDPRTNPNWYVQNFLIKNNTVSNSNQTNIEAYQIINEDIYRFFATKQGNLFLSTPLLTTNCQAPTPTQSILPPTPTQNPTNTPVAPTPTATPLPTDTPIPVPTATPTIKATATPITLTLTGSSVSSITKNSAQVNWTSNQSAVVRLEYWSNNKNHILTPYNISYTTGGFVSLSNMTAGTKYYYKVTLKNASGTTVTSSTVYSFTTASL